MQASRWAPQAINEQQSADSRDLTAPQSSDPPATSTSAYADDATPFAQTGGETNDLFSDDFTPIAQPVSQPVPPEAPRNGTPHFQNPRGNRDARRARGRGRGGRAVPPPVVAHTENKTSDAPADADAEVKDEDAQAAGASAKPNPNDKANAAVRGDRSHTGGVARPRLTEDELTAKLEAVKLNNARREEAHRAAEEDEASFRAQEAQAQERRREDVLNRKRMEAEREKNRARKMAGRGGREWDEGKEEDTGRGRGRSGGYRRGVNGGVVGGPVGSASGPMHGGFEEGDEGDGRYGRQKGGHEGRGGQRGGRGRGKGRGRGSFDADAAGRGQGSSEPPSLGDANFPALAGVKLVDEAQKEQTAGGRDTTHDTLDTPTAGGKARHGRSPWRVTDEPKTSWADQVEEGV